MSLLSDLLGMFLFFLWDHCWYALKADRQKIRWIIAKIIRYWYHLEGKQVLVLIVPQRSLHAKDKFCLRSVFWWVSHYSLNQLLILQQQGHKLFVKRLLFLKVTREVLILSATKKGEDGAYLVICSLFFCLAFRL